MGSGSHNFHARTFYPNGYSVGICLSSQKMSRMSLSWKSFAESPGKQSGRGAMETPTLAEELGTTPHLSPQLQKARRLGLGAEELERLAIQRGCDYYHHGEPLPPATISQSEFSNEQLAIALLNPALRYHPQTIRLGAAMLGARGTDPSAIARLARMERCEAVVCYVAWAGLKYEPGNPFWKELLASLPTMPAPKSGVLPHPTRFIAMTGFTRRGVETVTEWIRPAVPRFVHG